MSRLSRCGIDEWMDGWERCRGGRSADGCEVVIEMPRILRTMCEAHCSAGQVRRLNFLYCKRSQQDCACFEPPFGSTILRSGISFYHSIMLSSHIAAGQTQGCKRAAFVRLRLLCLSGPDLVQWRSPCGFSCGALGEGERRWRKLKEAPRRGCCDFLFADGYAF